MNNDISGIIRMAGVTDDGFSGEFYHSEASGDRYSQVTPNDLDNSTEFEADTAGQNKPRTKNITPNEDLVLISSWLNISLDPVRSTNQKADQYWKRIEQYYNESIDGKYGWRSAKSLRSRWSKIQANKFCGLHTQRELAHKSGATAQDLIEETKLVYLREVKSEFQFEHCWNIHRHQSKWINLGSQGLVNKKWFHLIQLIWMMKRMLLLILSIWIDHRELKYQWTVRVRRRRKRKGKEKGNGNADTSQFDVTFSKYLEGKRKDDEVKMEMTKQQMEMAKQQMEQQMEMAKQQMEMDKKKLDIELLRVQADKERQDAKQAKEDEAIMMMNVGKFETEMQRAYFAKLQADVFARRISK